MTFSSIAYRLLWYFRKWRLEGSWERINRAIRERAYGGQLEEKSRAQCRHIVDCQSVKRLPEWEAKNVAIDAGKKVKGKKATPDLVVVDTPRVSSSQGKGGSQCQAYGLRRDQNELL